MSIWGSLFGTSKRYSQIEHALSEIETKKLVSKINVNSLSQDDESLVEKELVERRHGDGKISLQQIYETLLKLQNQNKISRYDKDGLMRIFEEYFEEHFGKLSI